jgi:hypothetical protein
MVPIEQEPFIGMWRDRSDIKAAAAWVRQLRAAQWSRRCSSGHLAVAPRGPCLSGVSVDA